MKPIRVAVWGTGGVGTIAIEAVSRRSDLELVAVRVHDPDKVGRDAGELAGTSALGVFAIDNDDDLFAVGADCVCYAAIGSGRENEVVAEIAALLEAGINVVTVSLPGMVHPPAFDAHMRDRLADAARRGSSTFYASGMEPGFAADHLPLTLLTMSRDVTSVRTQEIFRYDTYPNTFTMVDVFGFGRPAEQRCLMEIPGVQASAWGPPVQMVADALGWTVDAIEERYEKALTDRDLETASGPIAAGTVGAVRFETIAIVDGREAIVIEHVNRMAADLAPHWPTATDDGTYRVQIDGVPSMTCTFTLGDGDNASDDGMVGTTMRVINAIPAVCAAPPGLVSSLDLALTLPINPPPAVKRL